jgi:hypothetical protein
VTARIAYGHMYGYWIPVFAGTTMWPVPEEDDRYSREWRFC